MNPWTMPGYRAVRAGMSGAIVHVSKIRPLHLLAAEGAAWADGRGRMPRHHGELAKLHDSGSYVREMAPPVLAAVGVAGGPGTT